VDREAQLTLREIVSKDQWVEDVLRKKPEKPMRNGWQEHGSGASDSVGGSQQSVAGLDLSRKSIEKATKLLISSHELLETPRIPTSFLGIGLIMHEKQLIDSRPSNSIFPRFSVLLNGQASSSPSFLMLIGILARTDCFKVEGSYLAK
jgi:hypothetical protein